MGKKSKKIKKPQPQTEEQVVTFFDYCHDELPHRDIHNKDDRQFEDYCDEHETVLGAPGDDTRQRMQNFLKYWKKKGVPQKYTDVSKFSRAMRDSKRITQERIDQADVVLSHVRAMTKQKKKMLAVLQQMMQQHQLKHSLSPSIHRRRSGSDDIIPNSNSSTNNNVVDSGNTKDGEDEEANKDDGNEEEEEEESMNAMNNFVESSAISEAYVLYLYLYLCVCVCVCVCVCFVVISFGYYTFSSSATNVLYIYVPVMVFIIFGIPLIDSNKSDGTDNTNTHEVATVAASLIRTYLYCVFDIKSYISLISTVMSRNRGLSYN